MSKKKNNIGETVAVSVNFYKILNVSVAPSAGSLAINAVSIAGAIGTAAIGIGLGVAIAYGGYKAVKAIHEFASQKSDNGK